MEVPNRLAQEGEDLVVHRFPTGTLGLASAASLTPPSEPVSPQPRKFWDAVQDFFNPPPAPSVCAVCIPPGATLIVRDMPAKLQNQFCIGTDESVVFTQISAAVNQHRDAVRFSNGREMRLQELSEGQRVHVVDLSSAQDREAELTELARFGLSTR